MKWLEDFHMVFVVDADILCISSYLAKVHMDAPVRLKKASRWNIPAQSNYDNEIQAVATRNGGPSPLAKEGKHEKRKVVNVLSTDKVHLCSF